SKTFRLWRGFRDIPFCILLLSVLIHRQNQAFFCPFGANEFLCTGSGNSASSLIRSLRSVMSLRRAVPALSKAIFIA
ncbi:hypothetical protein MLM39_25045, partial [Escherichia coli]|nr:hypothetical protein [Escherichia coli]